MNFRAKLNNLIYTKGNLFRYFAAGIFLIIFFLDSSLLNSYLSGIFDGRAWWVGRIYDFFKFFLYVSYLVLAMGLIINHRKTVSIALASACICELFAAIYWIDNSIADWLFTSTFLSALFFLSLFMICSSRKAASKYWFFIALFSQLLSEFPFAPLEIMEIVLLLIFYLIYTVGLFVVILAVCHLSPAADKVYFPFFKKTNRDDHTKQQRITDTPLKNSLRARPERKKKHLGKLSVEDELRTYKKLLDEGLITEEEYIIKKKQLLNI